MSLPASISFEKLVADYRNTAAHNDALHQQLTEATWADPVLAAHRQHVEQGKLGFGDPAFHSMWASLLTAAAIRFGPVRALEIGIFKGQVISLWALLARHYGLKVEVSALGPLAGQPRPTTNLFTKIRYRFSPRYREQIDNANFYAEEDYAAIVRAHFAHHGLDFDQVKLHRGFSTDPALLDQLASETFHIVYVDGDHRYEGALHDFKTFAAKIPIGGWLVADDAGGDLPGSAFWKGHEAVTRAVQIMPTLGFKNVLNVGHNRIFERVGN
ncbi:MAG: class I SAM-dependent methyltransferase, partial [Lacunisphaera sp.]